MSGNRELRMDPDEPAGFQIRLKGHVDRAWADWLGGLTITWEENGDSLLTGAALDQAALHALLRKVRDSGMVLLSINPVNEKEGMK
jgi:hypothetical protein